MNNIKKTLKNFKTSLYSNEYKDLNDLKDLDFYYLENLKNENLKKNKSFNFDLEYKKLNNKKEKFYNENKENILEYENLKILDFNIEYKHNLKNELKEKLNNLNLIDLNNLENLENLENEKQVLIDKIKTLDLDIKELKENKKELINKNLNNKFFNIEYLENFIKYLNENDKRIINDKIFIWKLWKDFDLMDKSIYENVINYFILLFLDKNYFLNKDFINKKIKSLYSKKELKELNELNSFSFKELKSNYLENFNNKYIIEYIKEYEKLNKNDLENLENLINEKKENIENYKFNLLLIKNNKENLKNYKQFKNKHYKEYLKNENRINLNIKRISFRIKEKYWIFFNKFINEYWIILNEYLNIDKKELKKKQYKTKIEYFKNDLIKYYKSNYIKSKRINFLNYINNNLDLDLDKNKTFKELKVLVKHNLKTN